MTYRSNDGREFPAGVRRVSSTHLVLATNCRFGAGTVDPMRVVEYVEATFGLRFRSGVEAWAVVEIFVAWAMDRRFYGSTSGFAEYCRHRFVDQLDEAALVAATLPRLSRLNEELLAALVHARELSVDGAREAVLSWREYRPDAESIERAIKRLRTVLRKADHAALADRIHIKRRSGVFNAAWLEPLLGPLSAAQPRKSSAVSGIKAVQ